MGRDDAERPELEAPGRFAPRGNGLEKRPYSTPRLVSYGAITKLTRGSSGRRAEMGGMKAMCL